MRFSDDLNGFVYLPIPVGLLPSVLPLLADHYSGPSPQAATAMLATAPADSSAESPSDSDWTKADVRELARYANEFTKAALDACSRKPEEWILYSDLIKEAGITEAKARGQLGALTKLLRRQWPNKSGDDSRLEWPFDGMYTSDRRWQLRVSKGFARDWKEIARA